MFGKFLLQCVTVSKCTRTTRGIITLVHYFLLFPEPKMLLFLLEILDTSVFIVAFPCINFLSSASLQLQIIF